MQRHSQSIGVFAFTTFIVAFGGGASSGNGAELTASALAAEPAQLPASAASQIASLIKEKEARTPAQRKIASQLLYANSGKFAASMAKAGPAGTPTTKITSMMQLDNDGRVLVDIKGDLGGGLERRVEDVAGTVVTASAAHQAVRAWVPMANLETLAAQPVVRAIRPAFQATTDRADPPGSPAKFHMTRDQRVALLQKYLRQTAARAAAKPGSGNSLSPSALTGGAGANAGSVTSEGSVAEGATRARKFYNTDGTGVNVGVISDSDDFKESSIASGDLPADTVTLPGQSGRPGTGEGTAMMEIVHDVAPGAKLFFASAFNSPESFADNIRQLRFTYHCAIIVDDVGYYFESPFQDDIVAAAVNDVTNDGAVYVSSAGNNGNYDDGTSGTWEGDYKYGGTLATLPSGYIVSSFRNKVISNRIELGGGPAYLHWSDPGSLDNPQSSNDYDLFVLTSDLRSVAVASTDIQDGDDIPFEYLGFNIPAGYRVVIGKKASAQARALRVVIGRGEFAIATSGAVAGHNSTKDALAVAAVDIQEADGGEFAAGPFTPVELFSSDGPRRLFYDQNGTRLRNSVLFATGAGESRFKPDISGADGVVTTLPGTSGLNPFFGTSAAAPHVAAIAALIKSAVPAATGVRIRNAIRNGGLDIEQSGNDRNSGRGVSSAVKSLAAAAAKPQVFLELASVSATAQGGGPVIPGSSAKLTTQLVNNGGAAATAVVGTLSTSSPDVTITQPTANFPDLAAGASGTNAAPYEFDVSPSVSCGAKLIFTESVNYTGLGTKPTLFTVPVQTGAADPAVTTFTYGGGRVAIPDGNAAGVDIPLSVPSFGRLAKLAFRIEGSSCSATAGSTTVGLDHTWVGDITATLTSPSGTQVQLMGRPGGTGNSGNNFCQTTLTDDAAASIQSVTSAQAPYSGSFKPAQPLATFAGELADGDWILHVSDSVTIDTGGVSQFSIDASTFTCTP